MAVLSFPMKACKCCRKKHDSHVKLMIVDRDGNTETTLELCVECFNKGVNIGVDEVTFADPPVKSIR